MRRSFTRALCLTIGAAVTASLGVSPAAHAGWDTEVSFVWSPVALTVSGTDITDPVTVTLHGSDANESETGPVLAQATLTAAAPTATLPLDSAPGLHHYWVEATQTFVDPRWGDLYEDEWVGAEYRSFTVTGRPSTVTARIPSRHVRHDAKVMITGRASGPPGRRIEVQHHARNGTWVPLAATTTRGGGRFEVPAPTWWVARQTLRVYVAPTDTLAAAVTRRTGTITVGRGYRPQGTNQATYMSQNPRARWDPCHVLTYRINPHQMWKGGKHLVRRAFAAISAATGLRFRYAGKTRVVPLRTGRRAQKTPAGTAFTIGWSTPSVVSGLTGSVVGLGGPGSFWWSGEPGKHEWLQYREGGQVVFDRTAHLTRGQRFDLALHEIGHAIGLGHTDDRRLIMHGSLSWKPRRHYGRGDLRGLAHLGADNGCFPDDNPDTGTDRLLTIMTTPLA